MSTLVVHLPPRPRDQNPDGAGAPGARDLSREEWAYVLTHNGLSVARHGRAALALLPEADVVVAVPADSDVSWHRVVVPKAPSAKLRAALAGLLEEGLLADLASVHLALAPGAKALDDTWVATLDKPWLQTCLRGLESGGRTVDRVAPVLTPTEGLTGHFACRPGAVPESSTEMTAELTLTLSDAQGVVCVPLAGTVARQMVQAVATQPVRWTATPAAATAAERWLGGAVQVESEAERSLRAVRSAWNVLQFDLTPSRKGARMGRLAWQALTSAPWRPMRWGLMTLILVQWVALNVWAWTQQRAVDELKRAQITLAQATHPQLRVVIDAPLQMQRETDALRSAAGVPGVNDLEALLGAAATAWPEGQGPAQSLRYDPGQLTLATASWGDAEQRAFAARLTTAGWRVEAVPGRVTVRPQAPGKAEGQP